MTDSISIAVVVPCYNIADVIEPTLRSIQAQTRLPDEMIFVDDGSTDNTAEVISRLLPKATVLRCEHRGPAVTRNAGWRSAGTTHVAFLDGDDLWTPNHLANAEACLLQHPDLRWYACAWKMEDDMRHIYRDIRSTGPFEYEGNALNYFLAKPHGNLPIVSTGTVVARVDLLKQTGGFDEELQRGDDVAMWTRFASIAPRMGYSSEVGFRYIKRASSLSETPRHIQDVNIVRSRKLRDSLLACKGLTARQRRQWYAPWARLNIKRLIVAGGRENAKIFAANQHVLLSSPQRVVLMLFQYCPKWMSAWYRRKSVLRPLLKI